jgi:hypothetical protein
MRSYFADILTSAWTFQDLRIACSDYYHLTAMSVSQWRGEGASRATMIDMAEVHSASPHVLLRHTSPSHPACKGPRRAMNKTTTNDRLEFLHISAQTSVCRRGWKVLLGIVGFYVLGKCRLSSTRGH